MRHINDLKENEAIHVPTKETAKRLVKQYPKKLKKFLSAYKEGYNHIYRDDVNPDEFDAFSGSYHLKDTYTILSASDFLPEPLQEQVNKLKTDVAALQAIFSGKNLAISGELKHADIPVDIKKAFSKFDEDLKKEKDFEVGKWYQNICGSIILSQEVLDWAVIGYAILTDGRDYERICLNIVDLKPAALELVEENLIKEAKRMGYKEGDFINSLGMFGGKNREIKLITEKNKGYKYFSDVDELHFNGWCIYAKGKWAEIVEQPLTELPEKWCVKDCKEVTEWLVSQNSQASSDVSSYYYHSNIGFRTYIKEGYTEITLDDFKRLVLDKEQEIDWGIPGQLVENGSGYVWETLCNNDEHYFEAIARHYCGTTNFGQIHKVSKSGMRLCPPDVVITLSNK